MQLGINFKISNTRSKGSQRPRKQSKTIRKANTLVPILLTSKRTYQGPLESKKQEKKRQYKHDIQKNTAFASAPNLPSPESLSVLGIAQ